jgi:CPA2 family monovalent cation:H+ antiporter-2
MEGAAIFDFAWVLLFAALAGMVSVRLRLPPVAGLLVAGMLIGPNVLRLVELPTIEAFAEIGSVLLLFMIGVEFSIAKLMATGIRAVLSSLLLIFLTFTIMHEIAILLGFDIITSLFIGSMFSMSSTAIMMKILEQKKLVDRQEAPVLVAILIIEDIIAVFMLTFFSSLRSGSVAAGEGLLGAVIVSLGILAFGYIILLRVLQKFSQIFLRYQADDTLILFSFTLGIGMSVAASLLGLTPAIGAFLAGSIIAGLPNGRDFEHSIRPFSHVFSSFFFLSIGMLIDPAALLQSAEITLILIGGFMVVMTLATAFAFYLISTNGRSSVFAGLAMLPLGEFSLLIASQSIGLTQINLVGVASVGVLVTSVICSFTLNYSEHIYLWLKSHLPKRLLTTLRDSSAYFLNVISTFEPEGYFHMLFISEVKNSAADVLYILGASIFYIMARGYLQFSLTLSGYTFSADTALLVLLAMLSLVPLAKLVLSLKKLFDALAMIFSRSTPVMAKGSILRNVIIGTILLLLFANYYLVVDFLLLPRVFNWLSIVFGMLAVFFFWSAVRASALWLFLSKRTPANLMEQKIVTAEDDMIIVGPSSPPPEAKPGAAGKKKPAKKRKIIFLR